LFIAVLELIELGELSTISSSGFSTRVET